VVSREQILECLKGVKYPGFERDIVAYGFVKDIEINDDKVEILIDIVSANKDVAKTIYEAAIKELKPLHINPTITIKQPEAPKERSNSRSEKNIAPHIKNFVMISSGKGGVGKSTSTVNLAIALSLQGKKVGILDADIYGPNIPRMLGVTDIKPDVVGQKLKPIEIFGIEMMSMGVLMEEGQSLIWRGAMIMKAIEQLLRDVLWSDLDVLFIDMPPGTGDAQLTLAQSVPVTAGVCVTTPQIVALDDTKRSLDMFKKLHISIAGIIENMSGFICPESGKEYDIFGKGTTLPLAKEYNTTILAEIPIEPKIREGGDGGKPISYFYKDSQSAKRYNEAALKLWSKIEEINSNGGGSNEQIQPVK
jgi:ATP-binding protein involved in chromosome partitioning